ncbi:MFS transporter [Minwuia thermotolerans]|uniref:MFS transporter n=1 Tax=Minwuia thermotolerans TaxID=2056226 RepID=UPI0013DDD384|nr:MFS transporter [Minwuia thermotolerans]
MSGRAAVDSERPGSGYWIRIVATVFLPFASGYFLSYLYRALPSLIGDRIREELVLDAGVLGLVGAAYFLAFGLAQLPVGMALDRYGPRRVQTVLLLIAGAGAVIFGLGTNPETLIVGRALIGLGCAAGLMGSFKAITLWFPQNRWPLVNGCLLGMGGLGALMATTPVEHLLTFISWHDLFFWIAGASAASSLLIFTVVPEKPGSANPIPASELLGSLKRVYSSRAYWRIAPMAVMTMATGMAIHNQWAGLWLKDVALFDQATVAIYLQTLGIALTAGFVLGGVVADVLGRYGIPLHAIMAGGVSVLIFSQISIALGWDPSGHWPWILLGLSSNMSALAFPWLCGQFPLNLAGRVNSALNVFVFLGVFAIASGLGWIIDRFPLTEAGGYAREGYETGLLIIIAVETLAFIWFLVPGGKKKNAGSEE